MVGLTEFLPSRSAAVAWWTIWGASELEIKAAIRSWRSGALSWAASFSSAGRSSIACSDLAEEGDPPKVDVRGRPRQDYVDDGLSMSFIPGLHEIVGPCWPGLEAGEGVDRAQPQESTAG